MILEAPLFDTTHHRSHPYLPPSPRHCVVSSPCLSPSLHLYNVKLSVFSPCKIQPHFSILAAISHETQCNTWPCKRTAFKKTWGSTDISVSYFPQVKSSVKRQQARFQDVQIFMYGCVECDSAAMAINSEAPRGHCI